MATSFSTKTTNELIEFIGGCPGTNQPIHFRSAGQQTITQTLARQALTEWLIRQGIPHSGPNSIVKASAYAMVRAYQNEKYLYGWLRNVRNNSSTPIPDPDNASSLDDLDAITDDDLDDAHDRLSSTIFHLAPTPSPSPQAITATVEQITRAAETVISRHLNQAKTDLEYTIDGRIRNANLVVTPEAEARIVALVESTALAMIEKLVPRKLEIKIQDRPAIILDESPRHNIFDTCLKWLATGENLYLVGPAGTGKTHLGEQLAVAVGKRFLPVPHALTKYEFSGFIDGSGAYRGTIVRDAIENGGLLMIDEIDAFAAAAVMFLNSVLANGYCSFPDAVVKKHPDFQVIAAANTYGRGATQEYVGRNPLDAASLDRFVYLICDYDEDMEHTLFGRSPWVLYVQAVRHAVQDLRLQHIISMRAIVRVQRGIAAGLDPEAVCEAALWRGLEKDSIAKIKSKAGPMPTTTTTKTEQSIVGSISSNKLVEYHIPRFQEAYGRGKTAAIEYLYGIAPKNAFGVRNSNLLEAKRLFEEYENGFYNMEETIKAALVDLAFA